MQSSEAIFSEVRRLVALLDAEERLALIRDIVTAPFSKRVPSTRAAEPPANPSVERRQKMQTEQELWYDRSEAARSQYAGTYVALHDGAVVDHDPDRRALYLRIREQYGSEPIPIIPAEQTSLPEFVVRNPQLVH